MNADFSDLAQQLCELERHQRRRRLVPRTIDGVYLVDPDGRRLLNFGGNDYLGLAIERNDHQVISGSGASALVCGWTDSHQQLADAIAALESTAAAVLLPSGYAACSGTVATLAQAGDLILSDALNHASLIDGCRLSRAERIIYRHRDVEMVASVLRQRRGDFRRVWIVTDGVFSMDGRLAPLVGLCDVADQYDACLIVDEAHGTGVLGDSGCGACDALGVRERVPIRIGTLSKAVGSQGGFVAGPRVVVDYLINRCRSLIYSTSLSPSAVAAAQVGIDRIRDQPELRQRVQQLAQSLRSRLSTAADPLEAGVPIVPIVLGEDHRAVTASQQLLAAGFYAPAIRPPTVPEGTARLRISLSAAHTQEMVDSLSETLLRLD